jgi:hypothetical protein
MSAISGSIPDEFLLGVLDSLLGIFIRSGYIGSKIGVRDSQRDREKKDDR